MAESPMRSLIGSTGGAGGAAAAGRRGSRPRSGTRRSGRTAATVTLSSAKPVRVPRAHLDHPLDTSGC